MEILLVNCQTSPLNSLPQCRLKNPNTLFGRENHYSTRSSSSNWVSYGNKIGKSKGLVKACFTNPPEEPILQQAVKEPVAFLGGMFAGILRLDLNDDPLKEWVSRTVEAAGMTEEIDEEGSKEADDDAPQQIEIE